MTVAAFMDLALYDKDAGYYARAAQRSGRAGDFFTSVDVGPLFGELLAIQFAEMSDIMLRSASSADSATSHQPLATSHYVDLVEAGAGNGRLSADILRAARAHFPAFYDRLRLHLVEAGGAPRAAQRQTLGECVDRLASSGDTLPASFEGVLVANELLDAMPVHQVVMRAGGLREVFVSADDDRLATREDAPSTPALAEYLRAAGVTLDAGWRAEINLRAIDWIREAARRLRRGFIVIVDYGHEASHLYSARHSDGTLTTFARHTSAGPESGADAPAWLKNPGKQDITAHVDFTSVRRAAEREGCTAIGFLDQTYFALGLAPGISNTDDLKTRLALKTLTAPGGLGSTHKVLILGKGVGSPALAGCSFRMRVT
jgi:SAM-dependent MidA family methyltransferase